MPPLGVLQPAPLRACSNSPWAFCLSFDDLLVCKFNYRFIPCCALEVNVVALAVRSTPFVVFVQEPKLVAMFGDDLHHVTGRAVILNEGAFTLLEFFPWFARLGLVQSFPLVLHHVGDMEVDGELDVVGSVNMIQTNITFMVIVLQDQ
ncbi:hypothetical protein D3C85_1102380 [compost metagenome]